MSKHFFANLKKYTESSNFLILVLFITTAIAFGLRFARLDQAPRGALIDEAHFGYLAKSLIQTGKDEHSQPWPLIFKGFGDQKLPGYGYLLIPFVMRFGLSVFTIRLPSVLIGTALVPLIYVLVRSLKLSKASGVVAAVLMAVSPWPFFLSRFGFESHLALLWFVIGLIFVAKMADRKEWYWPVGAGVMWALTWYSYIAYRPVTAGLVLAILGVWVALRKVSWKQAGLVVSSLVVGVALLFSPAASSSNTQRLKQVGIFNDPALIIRVNEQRAYCHMKLPGTLCFALWNKPTVVAETLISRFLATYSPEFLATEGEVNEIFMTVARFGQFYAVSYLFFIIGLYRLFFVKDFKNVSLTTRWLIGLGLLFAPIPGVIAGDPQRVRMSTLLPFLIVTMAEGAFFAWTHFSQILDRRLVWLGSLAIVGTFIFSTFTYMIDWHTVHVVKNDAMYQGYAPRIWEYVQAHPEANVYIKPYFSDPIMSYAFYTDMDPAVYQQQAVLGELEPSGFQHTKKLGRLEMGENGLTAVACQAVKSETPTLYVAISAQSEGVLAHKVMSENGVLTYAYIYDAFKTGLFKMAECSEIDVKTQQLLQKKYADILKVQ